MPIKLPLLGDNRELTKVCGTANRGEQVKFVKSLIQALNMPIVDLIIRFDPVTDQVEMSTIGANLEVEVALQLLERARKIILEKQEEALKRMELEKSNGRPENS